MGTKPSKLGDSRPSDRRSLRTVLTPNRRKRESTPSLCTTAHEIPIKTDEKQVRVQLESAKRASPQVPYEKSKKSRRKSPSMAGISSGIATKHVSLISNSDIGYSNISSWTMLSSDPFSQIEANTSAFTEITDQSTISRKSLYPVVDSVSPCHFTAQVMTQDILNALSNQPQTVHHTIIKEAYQRALQQNDVFDWKQFYNAIHHYVSLDQNKSIGIVYLAKCLISGLGVRPDIERGIQLLKDHPSCETIYALGQCYLDGLVKGKSQESAAFECFKKATEYEPINDSIRSTVAEAQCTLARMLFQGEGVEQNTKEALNYLMKSAENRNM
jgi:hypothetical protein